MASEVEICNRALQKLGAKRITSLSQDSVNARSCNTCYSVLRDAELAAHPWIFSISRAELAADAVAPAFGKANSYQIPSDFLRLVEPYDEYNTNALEWQIEGQKILTDDDSPIQIRYVAQVTDPNQMHVLFREALAARMAIEMCEELTQSNTKVAALAGQYKEAIAEARKVNALQKVIQDPPLDTWLTVRL